MVDTMNLDEGNLKILFIAPTSNLKTGDEILRAVQGQTVSICDGYVDRGKAEQFLRAPVDWIHFAGHGEVSVLEWSDGAVTVDELVGMLQPQIRLQGVVITACNSARTGAEIHNALHVPVVMCQSEISDPAAVRFSEAFYRALRGGGDIHRAVETGRTALAKVNPADADVVTLINGDMSTRADMADTMTFVRDELAEMRAEMRAFEASVKNDLEELKHQQPRGWAAILVLLVLLLVAQVATPWLTAAAGR